LHVGYDAAPAGEPRCLEGVVGEAGGAEDDVEVGEPRSPLVLDDGDVVELLPAVLGSDGAVQPLPPVAESEDDELPGELGVEPALRVDGERDERRLREPSEEGSEVGDRASALPRPADLARPPIAGKGVLARQVTDLAGVTVRDRELEADRVWTLRLLERGAVSCSK
jgi:hypothetical protein